MTLHPIEFRRAFHPDARDASSKRLRCYPLEAQGRLPLFPIGALHGAVASLP